MKLSTNFLLLNKKNILQVRNISKFGPEINAVIAEICVERIYRATITYVQILKRVVNLSLFRFNYPLTH